MEDFIKNFHLPTVVKLCALATGMIEECYKLTIRIFWIPPAECYWGEWVCKSKNFHYIAALERVITDACAYGVQLI